MRISDWSSDVCSSDLRLRHRIMTDRSLRAAVIDQAGTQIHCQAGAKRNGIVGVCTRIPFRSEWHPVAGKVSTYPVGIQTGVFFDLRVDLGHRSTEVADIARPPYDGQLTALASGFW